MPYTVGSIIQTGMTDKVRDILGVDTSSLPDPVILGLPLDIVTADATRRVPTWAVLTAMQRLNFDIGVALALAVECIEPLRTLYADGESTADMRGGRYDWSLRQKELEVKAQAYFSLAAVDANSSYVTTQYRPFRVGGPSSMKNGYRSPDSFANPVNLDPLADFTLVGRG